MVGCRIVSTAAHFLAAFDGGWWWLVATGFRSDRGGLKMTLRLRAAEFVVPVVGVATVADFARDGWLAVAGATVMDRTVMYRITPCIVTPGPRWTTTDREQRRWWVLHATGKGVAVGYEAEGERR